MRKGCYCKLETGVVVLACTHCAPGTKSFRKKDALRKSLKMHEKGLEVSFFGEECSYKCLRNELVSIQ